MRLLGTIARPLSLLTDPSGSVPRIQRYERSLTLFGRWIATGAHGPTFSVALRKLVVADSDNDRREGRWHVATVVPTMLRAALDDGVARLHGLGDTVVKLERDFPGQDHLEVDSSGPVKSRTFREVALIIFAASAAPTIVVRPGRTRFLRRAAAA